MKILLNSFHLNSHAFSTDSEVRTTLCSAINNTTRKYCSIALGFYQEQKQKQKENKQS